MLTVNNYAKDRCRYDDNSPFIKEAKKVKAIGFEHDMF